VVVRSDLPPGAQIAQAIHAAVEHALTHPEEVRGAPTLVVLENPGHDWHLAYLAEDLTADGHVVTVFQEPDLDDEPTALATVSAGSRRLRRLPLLLKIDAREGVK
jgi:hypothetical protein